MGFHTESLTISYTDRVIVDNLSIQIPKHKITAIVGSNGCGKSTILKTLARILSPKTGSVYLDGKSIHTQPTKQVAKQLAILPQTPEAPEGTTVRQLVSFGRFPHQRGFGILKQEDHRIIDWAIEMTHLQEFAHSTIDQLSGGQRQRAWIAMALAQETENLLLDEPTTYLDMAHQHEVLMLLEQLNREQNRTIVMVVHDLNHAARFAHHMVAIREGKIYQEGTPAEVICPDVLRAVFRVEVDIIHDPRTGVPLCLPYQVVVPNKEANPA